MSGVTERIKEVVDTMQKHGVHYTEKKFNLSSETIYRYGRMVKMDMTKKAKILLFDIENTPIEAYVWNKNVWNAHISADFVKKDWNMLSWSAKWLNDSTMYSAVLTPKEAVNGDDGRIVKLLWDLFDEADIIIAHNAERFDVGMANTRFIKHGLTRPSPYRVVDTLKIARREFNFTHNGLDALGSFLDLGNKIKTDFQLWKDCMNGDKVALAKMSEYNDQDVMLLEEVYYKLRGWTNHVNVAVYTEDGTLRCATCGGTHLTPKKEYYTNVASYNAYVCSDCGNYTRDRIARSVEKPQAVSIAR